MKSVDFVCLLEKAIPQLKLGAFLISGADRANPMTIGWAQFGIIWGKPICTVFVRHSRFSYELMEKYDTFTVCVPDSGSMSKELAYCGKKSGRDCDKLSDLQLFMSQTQSGGKLLDGCKLHFVCKTVAKTEMDMKNVSKEILDKFYNVNQATSDGDPHTIYFGEIIDAFTD